MKENVGIYSGGFKSCNCAFTVLSCGKPCVSPPCLAHPLRGSELLPGTAGTGKLKSEGKWFSLANQRLPVQGLEVSFLLGLHMREGVLVFRGFSLDGSSVL